VFACTCTRDIAFPFVGSGAPPDNFSAIRHGFGFRYSYFLLVSFVIFAADRLGRW